jgi:hypothetical protein
MKFISDPTSPPRLEDVQGEGKGEVKERRKVGEGDDTVTMEDASDDEDEETLMEQFQLRSRFSRAGMLNIPVIIEKPASLEASIPVPPRRPRNATRKRTAKKLRISKTTNPKVSNVTQGSRVSSISSLVLTCPLVLSQDIPPSDPIEQDEEETWYMVGAAAERSISPPPTTRGSVPDSTQ